MDTRLAIIEGAYLKDILEQPAATRRTLDALTAIPSIASELRILGKGKTFERIVLTGMGSSLHALHPLTIRLNRAGFIAQAIETSELIHYYAETLGPRTLLVAVSQSGESAEIVRLLRDRTAKGTIIGVTNSPASTLEAEADLCILTAAGPESTVSCKTYLATLQALHWLGSQLLGEESQNGLVQAQAGIEAYLSDWQAHVDWFIDHVAGIQRIFVTGRGWSLATAGTGGLILKESVRFAAEGMSSAAFRHGPFELLSPRVLTCICLGEGEGAALNLRLHEDVRKAGGRSLLIAGEAATPALRIGSVEPALSPLIEILPIQMLTLAIGAQLGEEAGRFSLATKVTAVE